VLSPEPMRHCSLVVLSGDLEAVTRAIAHIGVLHLLHVRHAGTLAAIRPYDVSERLAEITGLARTLDDVAAFLAVPGFEAPALDVREGGVEIGQIAARAAALRGDVEALRRRQVRVTEEGEQLRNLVRNLRALAPLGVPLEQLRQVRYVYLASGLLPERNLVRLRNSLARLPHLIVPSGAAGADGRVLVTALCLRPSQEAMERALRSAQFERLELPAQLSGTPAGAVAQLEEQLGQRRAEAAAVDAERVALGERYGMELRALRATLARERLLVEARGLMGRSERISLISGWVPAVLAPRLEAAVRAASAGRCVLQWQEPEALEDVRRGRVHVPILMHNPVLVRPFEHMLRAYGLPRYGEVDPTAVVAVGFLAMFGFMFGDVGQGAVLFAVGYFIYRRMFRYRDYAIILMECGVFAIGFGLLYGSVFGVEHWLPALWLRPLDDMAALMKTAIAFGVVFLSIGLIINVVNALRRRDWGALWERNGVLAALAYWMAIGLLARRVVAGPEAVTLGGALLWLALPLALILLKEPVRAFWKGARGGQWPELGELFAVLVQSLVEVVDTMVSAVSNTATFIRLAAFALSHAGLFLATFSVADAVAHSGAGAWGAGLVIVFGNVVIIGLEGLIVSIQSVRLEYYEFFSKFYSGGGEEYRPLRFASSESGRA
jgi:V/A-type H+/Na+-transporting ATPase subunit I